MRGEGRSQAEAWFSEARETTRRHARGHLGGGAGRRARRTFMELSVSALTGGSTISVWTGSDPPTPRAIARVPPATLAYPLGHTIDNFSPPTSATTASCAQKSSDVPGGSFGGSSKSHSRGRRGPGSRSFPRGGVAERHAPLDEPRRASTRPRVTREARGWKACETSPIKKFRRKDGKRVDPAAAAARSFKLVVHGLSKFSGISGTLAVSRRADP